MNLWLEYSLCRDNITHMKVKNRSSPFIWWLNHEYKIIWNIIFILCYIQTLVTKIKLKLYGNRDPWQESCCICKSTYPQMLNKKFTCLRKIFRVCKKQTQCRVFGTYYSSLINTILWSFIYVLYNLKLPSKSHTLYVFNFRK